eukprot:357658-Chlamydomonas_euryale.AAC.4
MARGRKAPRGPIVLDCDVNTIMVSQERTIMVSPERTPRPHSRLIALVCLFCTYSQGVNVDSWKWSEPPSASRRSRSARAPRTYPAMALDAMEHGRTVLQARLAGGAATAAAQDTEVLAGARQAAVGAAGRLAAARFWSSVEEFAHNAAAVGAFEGLGSDHPFLCRRAGR